MGYGLIVFVYSKNDDPLSKTATLTITDTVFIEADQTADFTMTKGLIDILNAGGNEEDLAAFMQARSLTDDDNDLMALAKEVLDNPPKQGFMTISPALQWRLQYKRAIEKAGTIAGVLSVYKFA